MTGKVLSWGRGAFVETHPGPGKFSLLLSAGTTPVDALVEELEHEPNGYFWEGVARRLVAAADVDGFDFHD